MEVRIFTVSELTDLIKQTLEDGFPGVWVTGEISNYIHHSSGHRYFTVKDRNAQIKAVIWKFTGQNLPFEPQDGMKVKLFGDLTVYPKNGQYQLRVNRIAKLGVGDLEAQFQELKEKLLKEGLFDDEAKQPLPPFPKTIGLVTSPTGAAIRDMINILQRRAPWVKIILAPVHVQGDTAAPEIAQAIEKFNRYGRVDLIICGRGGGSLEDLWAFNEEIVARAIYASEIPVVSAVGHQVDFTISDFVADLRAPTPSAAAELTVPERADLIAGIDLLRKKLSRSALTYIELAQQKLTGLMRSPVFKRPLEFVYQRYQELDEIRIRLAREMQSYLKSRSQELQLLTDKLYALSPQAVLQRGFAVVRKSSDGSILRDSNDINEGAGIEVKLSRGELTATVADRKQESD